MFISGRFIHGAALSAALLSSTILRAEIVESVVQLPIEVTFEGQSVRRDVTLTIFRDDARAKGPFMVLSHGGAPTPEMRANFGRAQFTEQARYFAQQGFVVFVPTRIGYGVTGGPNVENWASCSAVDHQGSLGPAVAQVAAVASYAREQSSVDASRGVLVGLSVGGFTSIAAASAGLPGVRAAINFAGGAGGDPKARPGEPCRPDRVGAAYEASASGARLPTLWLYARNDHFWGVEHPRAWFARFSAAGGLGEFVSLRESGEEGHFAFVKDMDGWKASVAGFLKANGF